MFQSRYQLSSRGSKGSFVLSCLLLLCIFCIGSFSKGFGQVSIQGSVVDSLESPLEAASVMLLAADDSVMKDFALTHKEGVFLFRRVRTGSYLLNVSFLGYQPTYLPIEVEENSSEIQLDPIRLLPRTTTLEKVTIEGDRTPIRMRKDTIEYHADAFKTQPNAVVEDLLKKLPGVEVERDGTIKAQGEEVRKVLVEGKEFFGNDPRVATKNLPADAVDKVQVFDKQSDMAEFTGIDDGQEQKTINLALKEGKKKGIFGKVGAGYGSEDRFDAKGNINQFNKKRQLSFLGNANNINQQGFSVNDYIGFMGGMGNLGRGTGLSFGGNGSPILLNSGRSDGFVETLAGGINFNQELSKKTDFQSSYFFNRMDRRLTRESQRENLLTDALFSSTDSEDQRGTSTNHRVNLFLKHELDASQQLVFRANVQGTQQESQSSAVGEVFNAEGLVENTTDRDNQSGGNQMGLNGQLTYRKRMNKKGRSLSLSVEGNYNNFDNDFLLSSQNSFFLGAFQPPTSDTLIQSQWESNRQFMGGGKLNLTEPLGKNWVMGASYSYKGRENTLEKNFFDLDSLNQQSGRFNAELSNDFTQNFTYSRPSIYVQFSRAKWRIKAQVDYQWSHLEGLGALNPQRTSRKFSNFLPSFSGEYEISTARNLNWEYQTRVQEPSLLQLQPIVDNRNPLVVYQGNPHLRASYIHSLNLHYFSYVAFSQTNLFAFINTTYTQDPIVQARRIDSAFRQNIQPINVEEEWQVMGYASFGAPIKALGIRVGLDMDYQYTRGYAQINAIENQNTRHMRGIKFKIENRKKESLDVAAGVRLMQSTSTYSHSAELSQSFLNQQFFVDLSYNFSPNLIFQTKLDYDVYSGESFGSRQEIPIWQAQLSQFVFENQRGEISLSVFDLLNQNRGLNRNTYLTYTEEERISSLGRYVMLGFTYSLSRFGLKQEQSGLIIESSR